MTKILPHDIDAEGSVCGSLLIDSECIYQINPPLKVSDFYSERNALVYNACVEINKRGSIINQITVAQELNRTKNLDVVGGAAYLSHLIAGCATSLDIDSYSEIVRRLSMCRTLIKAGEEISKLAYQTPTDMTKTLNQADEILLNVRKMGVTSPIITPQERAEMLNDRYTELYSVENGVALKSGIHEVDLVLGGGFYAGDMVILGARPGVGKTTMLQTIANNIGKTKNVLFCSAEMTVEGLSDRDVAGLTRMPINTIRLGGYTAQLYGDILVTLETLRDVKVYYYRDMPLTTDHILQAGVGVKLRYGLDAIVVDYLGMLDDEYGHSQYERVGHISRKIKQIAMRLNVPVIIAHQLNRDLEKTEDKVPQLSDLRDSGKVEEDADVVMFLYRDSYYNQTPKEEDFPTDLIIAKQRQGQSNKTVKLIYNKPRQAYFGLHIETENGGYDNGYKPEKDN